MLKIKREFDNLRIENENGDSVTITEVLELLAAKLKVDLFPKVVAPVVEEVADDTKKK